MPPLPRLTAKQIEKVLLRNGFRVSHQKGSHRRYRDDKGHAMTVAHHSGETLHPKTTAAIIKQSGLQVESFTK